MNKIEKLKSCPFCRGDNIKMMHKDVGFIGWNGFGAKKIKYQSYAMCNRCYSKGAPATCEYEVDTERGRAILEENDKKAAAAWNRRATENPQPLTLDKLIRMDGEPIWTVTIGLKGSGRWELCEGYTIRACPFKGALRCVDLSGEATLYDYKTYGKKWLAYRTKPEGSGE